MLVRYLLAAYLQSKAEEHVLPATIKMPTAAKGKRIPVLQIKCDNEPAVHTAASTAACAELGAEVIA